MKTIINTIALIAMFSTAFAQGEKYTINNNKSTIKWHAEKVTGSHEGNVNVQSGILVFKNDKLTSGSFEIDMTTISCSDIENPEYNAKLVGHLKSDDFFSVDNNPTAKLVITSAKHKGNNTYDIKAKMTIKNITKEIKFVAVLDNNNDIITGSADITIDRTEFDIKYGSGSFFDDLGDKAIYDNFDLKIKLVAFGEGKKA